MFLTHSDENLKDIHINRIISTARLEQYILLKNLLLQSSLII